MKINRDPIERYRSLFFLSAITMIVLFACQQNASAQTNIFPSDGNAGIGTTSPNHKLELLSSDAYKPSINILSSSHATSERATIAFGVNSTSTLGWALGQDRNANGTRDFYLFDVANTRDVMYWSAAGKVGVGTISPLYSLDVNGGVNSFRAKASTTSSADTIATFENASGIQAIVRANGYVGIGTINPTRPLEVLASSGEAVRLYRNANNVGWGVNLKFAFNNSSGGEVDYAGLHGVIGTNTAGAEGGHLVFTTSTSGSLTEKMRIDPVGNVGIGTTAPGTKLNISSGTDTATSLLRLQTGVHGGTNFAIAGTANNESSMDMSVYRAGQYISRFGVTNFGQLYLQPSDSNVGIGTTNPDSNYKLDVVGNVRVSGNIAAKYQDVAEWVPAARALAPGTVVTLHPTQSNLVEPSSKPYDTGVAGVISEQPGITLGERGENKVLVATTGRVRIKVDASNAPIKIGDLLVTSEKEGVAMKSEPVDVGGVKIHRPGTIIGKALEPLAKGTGEILVLLSLQ